MTQEHAFARSTNICACIQSPRKRGHCSYLGGQSITLIFEAWWKSPTILEHDWEGPSSTDALCCTSKCTPSDATKQTVAKMYKKVTSKLEPTIVKRRLLLSEGGDLSTLRVLHPPLMWKPNSMSLRFILGVHC